MSNICSCCKTERENASKEPREMIEVTRDDDTYLLCTYCDGDAILGAKAQESSSSEQ